MEHECVVGVTVEGAENDCISCKNVNSAFMEFCVINAEAPYGVRVLKKAFVTGYRIGLDDTDEIV